MLRVLFTAVPAFGHDVPMLPLLTAAEADGHDVAFATSGSYADALADVPLLDVGPGAAELVAEATRRDGGVLAIGPGNMTGQVGLFTDTRVDLTWSDSDGRSRWSRRLVRTADDPVRRPVPDPPGGLLGLTPGRSAVNGRVRPFTRWRLRRDHHPNVP